MRKARLVWFKELLSCTIRIVNLGLEFKSSSPRTCFFYPTAPSPRMRSTSAEHCPLQKERTPPNGVSSVPPHLSHPPEYWLHILLFLLSVHLAGTRFLRTQVITASLYVPCTNDSSVGQVDSRTSVNVDWRSGWAQELGAGQDLGGPDGGRGISLEWRGLQCDREWRPEEQFRTIFSDIWNLNANWANVTFYLR